MRWLLPKRNRMKRRSAAGSERSDVTRWNFAKYDESTGQVYLETTAAVRTSDDRDWARDSRMVKGADYRDDQEYEEYVRSPGGERKDLENYQKRLDRLKDSRIKGSKGARSLQDAAIECILENISDITLEGIECLPISIVRRIWHAVNKRCSRCFNTWSIFAKILRQDDTLSLGLLRYHQEIKAPNCRLDVYTSPLTSKSYEFITSLSITTSYPVPDLIKLSAVTNLGALEIINTQGVENLAVADRLLRSWHQAALNDGAFSVLRVLKLWNHEGLTGKSLAYVNGFPALALYDVKGCSFDPNTRVEATRLGWKTTLETDILGLLEKACVERALLMQANLGIQGIPFQKYHSERLWNETKVRRVSRAEVPAFLASGRASVPRLVHMVGDVHDASETIANAGHLEKEPPKHRLRKSKTAHISRSDPLDRAWDLAAYRSFARIGELRSDTDLVRAGVVIGDQAVVGSELVNSFPVVSLRLGESPSWLESSSIGSRSRSSSSGSYYDSSLSSSNYDWKDKPYLAVSTLRGLAFIRIKTASLPDSVQRDGSHDSLGQITQKFAGSEHPLTQTVPSKNQTSGIIRSKKRRLDDVLSSFL